MDIMFLGTAAAEGMPAVFCNCEACVKSKSLGGKNIRTRSQIMINDDLMMDFPMDSYLHMIVNKLDLTKIKNIFITHAHMDHCYPLEFTLHGEPYAHNMTNQILNIYGNETVITRAEKMNEGQLKEAVKETLKLRKISSYSEINIDGYKITSLPAEHTKFEDCLTYVIDDGKKVFMQFNDSGILPDSVYEWMAKKSIKIDAISFDCTYGYFLKGKGRHMGVLDNINERNRMKSFGLLNDDCKFYLTHFSHNSGMLHDEFVEKVKGLDFIVCYDGMKVTL